MMKEDTVIDLPSSNEEEKCCSTASFKRYLHWLLRCFLITGERRVKRQKLTSEDFELPETDRLAQYDPKRVAQYWNSRNDGNPWWKRIRNLFLHGIFVKLIPVLVVYLTLFYVLNIYGFNSLLCEDSYDSSGKTTSATTGTTATSATLGTTTPSAATGTTTTTIDPHDTKLALSRGHYCDKTYLQHWITIERDFTKILTFFIGFFVSLSVKNFFDQVRLVPHLDQILIQMNNFLWVDPNKMTDDVQIKNDMTAKQFSNTIVRYFLLSWTLCLSRMSVRLNEEFTDELALNKKRLMLKREFDILNCGTERDSWREKWSTPLAWVAKMVNDANIVNSIDKSTTKILDIKDAIGKTLGSFCQDLQKLNSYNDYRMPAPLVHILSVAIYVFLIINIASGQDMYTEPGEFPLWRVFTDYLPWFSLTKYLMLFGWLKVASDLTVPFGKGSHCIDLLGFLDFEIWKASHMLAQDLPLQTNTASRNSHSNNQAWDDFSPYWNKNYLS